MDVPDETNRFGWSKQIERDSSSSLNVERVPSGRVQGNLPSSVFLDTCRGGRRGGSDIIEDEFDYSETTYEQDKPSSMMNKKVEKYQEHADDDLNALLKVTLV